MNEIEINQRTFSIDIMKLITSKAKQHVLGYLYRFLEKSFRISSHSSPRKTLIHANQYSIILSMTKENLSYPNRLILFNRKLVACSCYPFNQRKRKRENIDAPVVLVGLFLLSFF